MGLLCLCCHSVAQQLLFLNNLKKARKPGIRQNLPLRGWWQAGKGKCTVFSLLCFFLGILVFSLVFQKHSLAKKWNFYGSISYSLKEFSLCVQLCKVLCNVALFLRPRLHLSMSVFAPPWGSVSIPTYIGAGNHRPYASLRGKLSIILNLESVALAYSPGGWCPAPRKPVAIRVPAAGPPHAHPSRRPGGPLGRLACWALPTGPRLRVPQCEAAVTPPPVHWLCGRRSTGTPKEGATPFPPLLLRCDTGRDHTSLGLERQAVVPG